MLMFSSTVERLKMAKKRLADYVQAMQTDDVLAATDKAKVQARTLLEDQGSIADRFTCLTAAELLNGLAKDDE